MRSINSTAAGACQFVLWVSLFLNGCGGNDNANGAGASEGTSTTSAGGQGGGAGTAGFGGSGGSGGSANEHWQLDAGHYVPAKMPMQIIYPRPDSETNTFARHRNLYPNLAYRIPVVVQGGAWPFKYELTPSTTLPGVNVGGTLRLVGDHQEVGDAYGVISGQAPASGTYTVEVLVTDQEGAAVTRTWQVVVDDSAFIFFDENAAGSANLGTEAAPYTDWATAFGTMSHEPNNAGKAVYFREGTHTLTGFTDTNGNFRIDGDWKPRVWLGYPSENATISLNGAANFVLVDDDVFFGSLTFDGNPDRGDNYSYQFRVFGDIARGPNWFDCTFQNYHIRTATSGDNPSLFYFTGVQQRNVSVSHSRFTGALGNCLTAYQVTDSVWEHISLDHADFTGNTSGQNSHGAFYFKDGGDGVQDAVNDGLESHFTFRNVNAWDAVDWTGIIEPIGVNDQGDTQWVEVSYCTLEGGLKSPSGNSWALDHVFFYRNSLGSDIHGLAPTTGTDLHAEYNVLANDAVVSTSYFADENNVSETAPFDGSFKLTGEARTNYLGTHGAEVQ